MREVGAFEAKNKLSALLDEVANGGEVIITRRGRQRHVWLRPQRSIGRPRWRLPTGSSRAART